MNNELRIKAFFILASGFLLLASASAALAGPQSTTYELIEYGFGAGGLSGADSTSFSLFGTVGEVDMGKLTSDTYGLGSGLVFTVKADVPPAPSLTNPSQNYERLKFIVNEGGNPSDATYAIAISTDNFVADTRFIQIRLIT